MADETVEIVDLTKKLATELSEVIPDYQRRTKDRWIKALAEDMDSGRWKISPDALSVVTGPDGKPVALENGQHRVLARLVSETRKAVPVVWLTRPDENIDRYLVTDTNRKRSFGDYLKATGVSDYNVVAAVVHRCSIIDRHPESLFGNQETPVTQSGAAEWYEQCDKELLADCIRLARRVRTGTHAQVTPMAAIAYLASRDYSQDEVFEFFELVKTGREVDEGDGLRSPASLLHDVMITWELSKRQRKVPSRVTWYTIVKAWHMHVGGERKKMLKFAGAKEKPLPVVAAWMGN